MPTLESSPSQDRGNNRFSGAAAADYVLLKIDDDPEMSVEHELYEKNIVELHDQLFEFGKNWGEAGWSAEERAQVEDTFQMATTLHAGQEHKGVPYTYHLLRVAARVAGYLEKPDPELVIAAIMHDSVEDCAEKIIAPTLHGTAVSPEEAQALALGELEQEYGLSARSVRTIEAVTNPPDLGQGMTDIPKINAYADHVEAAIKDPDAWMVKFADWCDNGLNMSTAELGMPPAKIVRMEAKFGQAMLRLEARYREPDIQALLSPTAKAYVEQQFALGHERLDGVS